MCMCATVSTKLCDQTQQRVRMDSPVRLLEIHTRTASKHQNIKRQLGNTAVGPDPAIFTAEIQLS